MGILSKRGSNTTWYCIGIGPYEPETAAVEEAAADVQDTPVRSRRDSSIPGIDVPVSIFKKNGIEGLGNEEDLPF